MKSVSVNGSASFPGASGLIYEGTYTPTNSPLDVINNNNSPNPNTNVIRNGIFKVACKVVGFTWLSNEGVTTGHLNFNAIKH